MRAVKLLRNALLASLLVGAADCAYLFPSCATIPGCPVGQTLCSNLACVDLTIDPLNCGTCQNPCGPGLVCIPTGLPEDGGAGGACGCPISSQTLIHGQCIDLRVDPKNCGTLGSKCRPDQACLDGGCGCPSAPYLDGGSGECPTDAGPFCTDLRYDPANCGACGIVCASDCNSGDCDGGVGDAGNPADGGPDGGDAGLPGDGGAGDGGAGDGGPSDGGATDGGDGG